MALVQATRDELGSTPSPAIWPTRPRFATLMWLAGLRALVAVALLAPLAAFAAGQGDLRQAAWLALLPLVPLANSGIGLLKAAPDLAVAYRAAGGRRRRRARGGLDHRRPAQFLTPLLLLPVLAASLVGGRPAGLRAPPALASGVVGMTAVQYGWLTMAGWLRSRCSAAAAARTARGLHGRGQRRRAAWRSALLVGHLSESLSQTGADLARATIEPRRPHHRQPARHRQHGRRTDRRRRARQRGALQPHRRGDHRASASDVLGQPCRPGAAAARGVDRAAAGAGAARVEFTRRAMAASSNSVPPSRRSLADGGHVPGSCSRSRTSRSSSSANASASGRNAWPRSARWPPASPTRFAIRSPR